MKYTVKTPIKRDGKIVSVGETVDLDEKEAVELKGIGAIEDNKAKAEPTGKTPAPKK